FQLAHTAHFRSSGTTRAAVVVGDFHHYCKRRNVWTFLYWLSDLHRRRHMGKSDPGRLGLGHHQLRFLDRYRTRGHTDLRDLILASPKVAYVDQSFRGGNDAFCSYLRGDFPRHPRRPVLDGVVYGTDTEQLGHLAKLSQRADVGRVRGLDIFYRVGFVLVHRFGSGLGDATRSRDHADQEISIWNFRSWLARLESELAPLRDGVSVVGRSFYAARSLGAQRGIIRLRLDGYSYVAHHHLPAVFRGWRDLRRFRHGVDSPATGARDL